MNDKLKQYNDKQKELCEKSEDVLSKDIMYKEKSKGDDNMYRWTKDLKDDMLFKTNFRADDKVIEKDVLKFENVEKDENISILVEAYQKYHNKSLLKAMSAFANRLNSTKLSEDIVNRRKVIF